MKSLLPCSFLTLLCCLLVGPANAASYTVREKQLANGLRVVICERPNTQFSVVQMTYDFGAKDETADQGGLAEVMRFVLNGKSNKPKDVFHSEKIKKLGGSVVSISTKDLIRFTTTVPAKSIDKALEAEAARMGEIAIDEDWVTYSVGQAVLRRAQQQEHWLDEFNTRRSFWAYPLDHPYRGKQVMDVYPKTLIQDKYNRYIAPKNAFLVIVTSAKTDLVMLSVEKYFNLVPEKKPLYEKSLLDSLSLVVQAPADVKAGRDASLYSYCIKGPLPMDSDFQCFQFLLEMFFQGDLAIVPVALRSVGIGLDQLRIYPADGRCKDFTLVDISLPSGSGQAAEKAINRVFGRYLYYGFTQAQIDLYLQQEQNRVQAKMSDNQEMATEISVGLYYHNDSHFLLKPTLKKEDLTTERLKSTLRKYFISEANAVNYTIE